MKKYIKFNLFLSVCLALSFVLSNFNLPVLAYEKGGVNLEQVRTQTLSDNSGTILNKLNSVSKSTNALSQALSNKKQNLSEPKKKLGTDLLKLIDSSFLLPNQTRTQLISEMKGLKQLVLKADSVKNIDKRVVNKTHNDLVYVYVDLQPTTPTSVIDSIAWKVTDRDEENHLAVALIDVNKLETLALLNGVKSINSVIPPIIRSGSVITEGDVIHQTAAVRAIYSQGGAGMKIGVISDGVDSIASAKSTGDLPAIVTVVDNSYGGDEGTAMLEIIHDMVPDAQLYFHTGDPSSIVFNNAVDDLIAAGVNVIVDDLGFLDQPFFQDGTIASHVASVLASHNIVYVSAAGNDAKEHYQGFFNNNGSGWHDFSNGLNQVLVAMVPSGGKVAPFLQWNDNFGSSANDYDLYLVNQSSGNYEILAASENEQNGNDNPFERTTFTNTSGSTIIVGIYVRKYSGLDTTLEIFFNNTGGVLIDPTLVTAADSIYGHPAVPGVIAVGAIDVNDPGNDTIEPYSSQGPVTIVGQAQRAKPDITGIDCVSVTGAGGFPSPFCGTSAAAPAVAAIVAQLWGQFPTATNTQIKNYILNSAVDLGTAGTDFVFGHGRADSLLAFQEATPAPSSAKAITGFTIPSQVGLTTINESAKTIVVTMPPGTNVTALVPTVTITGASVSPASGVSHNFTTSPQTYTVTAADGSTQAYAVTINVSTATGYTISGTIKYYDGVKVIPGATVTLVDETNDDIVSTTITDVNGVYQFAGVTSGGDYVVSVNKSDDASGLSGNDQNRIGRHIVGLEPFNTIYKNIAGDVNNSGTLTGNDQNRIGRFIVGLDGNLPSGAWKFYSSDVTPTESNYLTEGLTRIYTNLIADTSNQDFIGIKMGDVNNSWVSI